mgnify:FL=1
MKKILTSIIFILSVTIVSAQKTYILCGKLLDAKSGSLEERKTILVEGNKIIKIYDGYIQPKDRTSKVINLQDKVVMPGLIDMHVHIENEFTASTRLNKFILNEADIAVNATVFVKRTLQAGFTTVRDLGGTGVNISIRNAINAGVIEGPRVFTSEKSLATTGGHADKTKRNNRKTYFK